MLSEAVLDGAPVGIIAVDADGVLGYLNRAAEEMFALDSRSGRRLTLAELVVAPGRRATLEGRAERDLLMLLSQTREMRGVRSDGALFPVEVTLIKSGEMPPQYTGFVRDLSASKAEERKRTRMQRLLDDAEELAAMGTFEVDLRTHEVQWSDALHELYGYRSGEVEVTLEHILARIHPDEQHDCRLRHEEIIESHRPARHDYRIQLDDGSIRHLIAKSGVERDDQGEPVRLFGTVLDVTEQRLTERELQAHHALTQALGEWRTFEQGVAGLLRQLGTAMDCDAASMWIRADRGDALVCRAFWAPPSAGLAGFEDALRGSEYPQREGPVRRAWDLMEPISIIDASTDHGELDRDEALAARLRSVLLLPAVHDGETLAVLAFYGRERRTLTARLIRTLSGLGHDLGRFLARRRAEIGFRPLSTRELEVLQLAAQGLSGPTIARRLVIGPATVKTHFEHAYQKLGVTDRTAAVAEAMRQGLIS